MMRVQFRRAARMPGNQPWPLRAIALAVLLGGSLGGCAGMVEAQPVCMKPAVKGLQRAPMYQCEHDMTGRRMVNR